MKKLWGAAAMIAATLLWGGAFSAQSTGMRYLEPLPFTAIRSVIGMIALAVLIIILDLARTRRLSFWGDADGPDVCDHRGGDPGSCAGSLGDQLYQSDVPVRQDSV